MKNPSVHYLTLAIKFILILSIINSVYNQLWHLMSTSVFLLILTFIPQIMKKSYNIVFPKQFEFMLLIFVIATLFIGNLKGIIVPIFFGIAISFIGFMISLILYSANQIKKNYFLIIFFSFNLAVVFGFLLELLKYYLKLILGHEITAGIYVFTMQNMTYVILGALISSILAYVYMKTKNGILGKVIEMFKTNNPKMFDKKSSEKELIELIKKGESEEMEFKETLRYNVHTNEFDRRIEHASLKTITAFINSEGGKLFIGIKNNGEISGIEKDKFENTDKFLLHLMNIIKQKIGKKNLHLIKTEILEAKEKLVALIECEKSNNPIFLRNPQNEEEFYIRTGPATTQIKGSELIDYVKKRFRKS